MLSDDSFNHSRDIIYSATASNLNKLAKNNKTYFRVPSGLDLKKKKEAEAQFRMPLYASPCSRTGLFSGLLRVTSHARQGHASRSLPFLSLILLGLRHHS